MRVYVETNFVLELALEQTAHEHCRRLLELADQEAIELALPAFSLYEAYRALSGKKSGIQQVTADLRAKLDEQLKRIEGFSDLDKSFSELVGALTKRLERAEARLETLRDDLLRVASILTLGSPELARRSPELGFADEMVYAAIESDPRFGQTPSCFVTTNGNDFREMKHRLSARSCKLLFRFEDATQYVEAALRRETTGP